MCFITAAGFLTSIGVTYEGYMTVALVVMETPAIIIAGAALLAWRETRAAARSR